MGACNSTGKTDADELGMGNKLKVAIVGVRGHLRSAEEEANEEQKEEGGEEHKGRFCVVKEMYQVGELYKTKAVEGISESVWKEEVELDKVGGLEFCIWEDATKFLGSAKLEASTFEQGFNGEVKLEETFEDVEAYIKLKISVDGNEYPELAPEYTVSLTKEKGAALGTELDSDDGVTVRVNSVDAGPIQTYNESEEAVDKVKAGDFIVKANKVVISSSKIMQELKSAEALELTIKRSEEFSVVLKRSDTRKPLGLDFLKKHAGNELVVTKVSKGAVEEWNSSNVARKMCKGDRIVAVGSKRGAAAELQKELNSAVEAKLTVVRPASPDSWQFA